LAIVNDPKRRDRLVRKYGKNAENVAYGTAVNQVKKQAANNIEEPQPQETMENTRLREMVIDALTEKKKSTAFTSEYDDKFTDKRKNLPDGLQKSILKKQGELDEDLDLGHEDDEPHMIKAELYKIGKYAMELYKMVDQFEGPQEVDFPAWWQAKITTAKNMVSSAKHYLEFELKEPQIDAMVGVASEEEVIDEKLKPSMGAGAYVDDFRKSDAPQFKGKSKSKKNKMAVAAYLSAKDKIKEAILAKLKNK
jgi:hypothetical protein